MFNQKINALLQYVYTLCYTTKNLRMSAVGCRTDSLPFAAFCELALVRAKHWGLILFL
jgi:hypothetical protein